MLKALGHSKGPQQHEGESELVILEIKETSDFNYSRVKTVNDIPMKFQWAQAAYQNILKIPKSMFLYVNRDSMALRTIFFEPPPEMWPQIQDKCAEIKRHIQNETIPTDEGDISVWDL